jgi:tetratricopeptide (TPR) repeat protein
MAWEEQAFLFYRLGELDQAIASAKRAVQLNPLGVMTVCDLGYIYYLAGRYEEAEAEYEAALELNPDFHLARTFQGHLAIAKGEYEPFYPRVSRKNPDLIWAWPMPWEGSGTRLRRSWNCT